MATYEPNRRIPSSRAIGVLFRGILVTVSTGVEAVVLVAWFTLVGTAPVLSRTSVVALGILATGLILEHFLTEMAVNGTEQSSPLNTVIFVSATEAVLWVTWLVIAGHVGGIRGVLIAGLVLAVLLVPQHTIEDNVLRGHEPFSELVDLGTLGFSIIEAGGATIWLVSIVRPEIVEAALVEFGSTTVDPVVAGLGTLTVAILLEHSVSLAYSRRARRD